jgi:hypothetical protein
VEGLLAAGAKIKVGPKLTLGHWLVDSGKIAFLPRPYQEGDLDGAFLVIAATDDQTVNQAVWSEAERRGCLVNVVDDPVHSNFILPAVVQREDLSVAISTGGSSPQAGDAGSAGLSTGSCRLMAELAGLIETLPAGEAVAGGVGPDILNVIQNDGRDAALSYGREKLHQGNEAIRGQVICGRRRATPACDVRGMETVRPMWLCMIAR